MSAWVAPRALPGAAAPAPAGLQVEVVVPVRDEEAVLERSVRRLHAHLEGFPFSAHITIADNASTDGTPLIAARLAAELDGVGVRRLEQAGRGRALRAAWTASDAAVVAYMDVDLSTDLRALLPLVAPLLSGHSDVAIGTRLAGGAQVVRGPRRELISRTYNVLLHATLRARFSDAQCGFKALRADAARALLPEVRDQAWFFDTELLVAAQRRGLRIHEVPVDWVDDPDSRVDIVPTAMADLRGIGRLLWSWPATRFVAIGVASTLAYLVLFLLLRGPLGAAAANVAALALTAVANTQANRRITFGVTGREGLARHQAQGFAVFLLSVALSSGVLWILHRIDAAPPAAVEGTVLVLANLGATLSRYVAMRWWIFARPGAASAAPVPTPEDASVKILGCPPPRP